MAARPPFAPAPGTRALAPRGKWRVIPLPHAHCLCLGYPVKGPGEEAETQNLFPGPRGRGPPPVRRGSLLLPLALSGLLLGAPGMSDACAALPAPGLAPHGHHPDPKSCLATTGVSIPARAGLPPAFIAALLWPSVPPGARLPEPSGLGRSQRLQSPATLGTSCLLNPRCPLLYGPSLSGTFALVSPCTPHVAHVPRAISPHCPAQGAGTRATLS